MLVIIRQRVLRLLYGWRVYLLVGCNMACSLYAHGHLNLLSSERCSGQMYEMCIHYVAPFGRLRIRTVREWGRDRYSNP